MVSENHFPTGPVRQYIDQLSELQNLRIKKSSQFQELTDREVEVLALIAGGRKNPAIAEELDISRTTVQNHRAQVRDKLNIKSQTDYIKYAMAFGLIDF